MRPSAEAERAVGIDWYVTDGDPCPARARSSPEDFVVEERISAPGLTSEPRPDYLPLYRVEKRGIDTMHMARELGEELRSRVSYAGLKDKRAVATQYVTPTSRRSERPQKVAREKFTARLVGYVPGPLARSALVANKFTLVLREYCSKIGDLAKDTLADGSEGRIPNFFGLQRFGTSGAGTHLLGRAMVRGRFEEAVMLMVTRADGADVGREAMEAFDAGDYSRLPGLIPEANDMEIAVAKELARRPGEWVRALRAVPVKLRRLYVQAYQSFIYNRAMSEAVRQGEDLSKASTGDNWAEESDGGLTVSPVRGVKEAPGASAVPMVQMVGYAFRDYGSRFDACIKKVLEAEAITPGLFYLQEMQEVSQEGGFRRAHLVVRDSSCDVDGRTVTLGFTMARGQYATVLLRELVKAEDPVSAGLA